MRGDVRQSVPGCQNILNLTCAVSELDVFPWMGTTQRVQESWSLQHGKTRIAAGVAIGSAVCLLFFFAPSEYNFYPKCALHSLTGLNCPGCGVLRATHELLHGNFTGAFLFNPLFVATLPLFGLLAIPGVRQTTALLVGHKIGRTLLLATLLIFTVLRNAPIFSGSAAHF